ncbi:TPA: SDR family NAD(P)-dependent oxidoreductase [Legionella pneumophila]|nr:SDR family NAD(P)-dependent oxidoreductase [Legionella pneumophila]
MERSHWNLKGKKALVTGGTRGIGRAIVDEFLELGAEVGVVAKNKDNLEKVINNWSSKRFRVSGIEADLNQEESYSHIISTITQKWGVLDILINNVGINIRKPAQDYLPHEFEEIMQTNLTSAFKLCQLAYPLLKNHLKETSLILLLSQD